jgi:hypothetical protein
VIRYNANHSYTAAFDLSAGLNLIALLPLFFLKRPEAQAISGVGCNGNRL